MVLGSTPYLFKGGQEDLKKLFYSDPSQAQSMAVTIPGGYGVIKAGTVLGRITESTNRIGNCVPYAFGDSAGILAGLAADDVKGIAYLVSDAPGGAKLAYVTMDDSYKFAAADHLAAVDSDYAGANDLGAISAIDRTTYSHMAKITVANNIDEIATAKGACIFIQTLAASPHVKAIGILMATVDTGVGENAKGSTSAVMVVGQAMLYKANLYGYNADGLADMSYAREDGKYLIM